MTGQQIIDAINRWPGLYESKSGSKFMGMPVSQIPSQLRECGWRNVNNVDEYSLQKMGIEVLDARYIGGARPKRFCRVAVVRGVA